MRVRLRPRPQSLSHQSSRWWGVRLAHLHAHDQITHLDADSELAYPENATWWLLADDERDLAKRCDALFLPGPRWDGTEVSEPKSPSAWAALHDQFQRLRRERDEQAVCKRTAAGFAAPRS
ncbi:hypothetical protein [Streptomyces sp. IBSBF 2435]|uniref:hypothetical protein n=1 Tax=Streptomyces sp. IBSBF 2435 TaxID=2903531 RepID=UPI002FDBC5FF